MWTTDGHIPRHWFRDQSRVVVGCSSSGGSQSGLDGGLSASSNASDASGGRLSCSLRSQ